MNAAGETGLRRVYFYGLFMDMTLLEDLGAHPTLIGPAELSGYELRIGDRATLVRSDGARAYGQLVDLSDDDVERLYAAPGLSDYAPERVRVRRLKDRSPDDALSYHLPVSKLVKTTNAVYARQLTDVARRIGLPDDYCRHIELLVAG